MYKDEEEEERKEDDEEEPGMHAKTLEFHRKMKEFVGPGELIPNAGSQILSLG